MTLWLCVGEYRGPRTAKAFVRYAIAKAWAKSEETVFRTYVTDTLQTISKNTARYVSGDYIRARYYDIIHPTPEETRTADEIIAHIKEGLRG